MARTRFHPAPCVDAAGELAEDLVDEDVSGDVTTPGLAAYVFVEFISGEPILCTVTPTFDASSMAVIVGHAHISASAADRLKVRLYAGGVEEAESGFIGVDSENIIFVITKALAGAQECKLTADDPGGAVTMEGCGRTVGSPIPWMIGVGSIKLV